MHGQEKRMLLRHYLEQGGSRRALARRLGISRDTLYRWIREGELDRDVDVDPPRYGPRPPGPTKLDPYKSMILARLESYPELTAVRILEEIRAAGYPGGYSQVRDYVRSVRPRAPQAPLIRFETPPGHQGQVDFADFRFPWGRRSALVVVLGYSRMLWVQFLPRKDMRALFQGLEGAFRYFGGVPKELLFDQMRSVITRDQRLEGGDLQHNMEFLRFARHWGFTPRACRPYRAQTKGKVERPIRYLRQSFHYGRDLISDDHLAAECRRWLEQTANRRLHATTRERPVDRFEREERGALGPLAARPYHSLTLPAPKREERRRAPLPTSVVVERRPLAQYAALAGGVR